MFKSQVIREPREVVTLFTDGSGSVTGSPGGWAFLAQTSQQEWYGHGSEELTTSNRMELTAVLEGFKTFKEPKDVIVVSDSKYVCNGLQSWIHKWSANGWRTSTGGDVKNRDIWEQILKLMSQHYTSEVIWVRGHSGHPENEFCDRLAGIERRKIIDGQK